MANSNSSGESIISVPQGGGAVQGIGETFSPDLFTGTGNFTIPFAVPPGRNGFQPELNLVYSTGNGNGPFGLGWSLSVPGITRKTSKGIPQYQDYVADLKKRDTFILSGSEDLVPVPGAPTGVTRYRPRTEGLFARIDHVHQADPNHWEVRSKDGLVSIYGTEHKPPNSADWEDPAKIADPKHRANIFAWKLTETRDTFGNRIVYEYERDLGQDGAHYWDQLYLKRIRYVDYSQNGQTEFLVSVTFDYENRPDPSSGYRPGFEIRTTKRCKGISVRTHAGQDQLVRHFRLVYLDQRTDLADLQDRLPRNGVSLLSQVVVEGDDGNTTEQLPPLEFQYTRFNPDRRDLTEITGRDLPPFSLTNPDYELVDLFGHGLPDILEMNETVRYWENRGGQFSLPREMQAAPAGLRLADQGVQIIDADGDGRSDLLVTTGALSGYYPLQYGGLWDRRSFQRYRQAPSFSLEDPEVRLVDLDGDGVTDAIRSGARFECYFNDPHDGWDEVKRVERKRLSDFPDLNFSDPRVKWADMTGDGLKDIVLVHDGNIEYWPNFGHGNWGKRLHMRNSPRFPYDYDPARILIGDVDGDGLADIVYVDHCTVTLWSNQSGNGWSEPLIIKGTPPVNDTVAVRLVDMMGKGVSGVLWSREAGQGLSRHQMWFHDFTGGKKPYLLHEMDNHMGAVTKVEYTPSTTFYLRDQQRPETRWKTSLPFPVQVVAKVEVIDHFSQGKLTTEYRYHHGYWDGAEREFRGFGMVEQLDTETFQDYHQPGLHGNGDEFQAVPARHFSPPTLTKTWFHQGPVGEEFGDWQELDWSSEYWQGDPPLLRHTEQVNAFLRSYTSGGKGTVSPRDRRIKRDALRSLRGNVLRSELYGLDGSSRQDRPYTVTEHAYGIREETLPLSAQDDRLRIFFPHTTAQRSTQWERGDDPMTQFSFTADYDAFGQPQSQTQIACPRGWRAMDDQPNEPFLPTRTRTDYAVPTNPSIYIHDRVARATSYEIRNTNGKRVREIISLPDTSNDLKIIGHTVSFYDGNAFVGLNWRQVGRFGALVRTESLVLTEDLINQAYGVSRPAYLQNTGAIAWSAEYPSEFQSRMPARAGYLYKDGLSEPEYITGYYVAAERRRYDFHVAGGQNQRGLTLATQDPLGQEITITPDDPYWLLPIQVTDAVGLSTIAQYDYRVFQPSQVTDPNGTKTIVTFTPLGLVATTAVQGQQNTEGDQNRASVYLTYGLMAFANSPTDARHPVWVGTRRHIHHDTETDIPLPARDETLDTYEYSDGFGRVLQTRSQAEDVTFGDSTFGDSGLSADQAGDPNDAVGIQHCPGGEARVVVSGWQIYDNKGQVVEKFEPFFDCGWNYAKPKVGQHGYSVTMYYDPRGQLIRTVNPDGSEQSVVYGVPQSLENPAQFTPTAWETYTYDANDNAGRTHPNESRTYQHHWNTPASAVLDALGRTIETVERNRDKGPPLSAEEEYKTRSTYDIQGNLLTITDPLGRRAFRHQYDLQNRPLRVESIDAGLRLTVLDALGNPIEQRDGKGAAIFHAYDVLNRPIRLWARDNAAEQVSLREVLEYGDGSSSTQTPVERNANRTLNRLGQLYRHYDEAGRLEFEQYDFKGNLGEKVRSVIKDQEILDVFLGAAANNWQVPAYRVNWEPTQGQTMLNRAAQILDLQAYRVSSSYDALNRIKTVHYPEDVAGERKQLRPQYNRAGALEKVKLDNQIYVERIAYNAKGQRLLIAYGNQVMTRYVYHPETFRLMRFRTEKYQHPNPHRFHPNGTLLQDFGYTYDLTGNIRTITDRVPGSGVHDNPDAALFQNRDPQLERLLSAGDALYRQFEYDSLYRLTRATGRESNNIPRGQRPWPDNARAGFNSPKHGTANQDNAPTLTQGYWEQYRYDAAGNILVMQHGTSRGSDWTRYFGMGGFIPQQWQQEWMAHLNVIGGWPNAPGNQLTHVGDNQPNVPQTHWFDVNGNMIREHSERHFEWDHSDRLRVFRQQPPGGAEPTVYAQYLYDVAGQRVIKVVRRGTNDYNVTVYIDGMFEYHCCVRPGDVQENNCLHVMDDQSRIAARRIGRPFPKDKGPEVQYHLVDHLGSSAIVIGGSTGSAHSFINREEYSPYGETSFGSFGLKRYRYTGKERDEESGLYYKGARYYAPWLARWVSCDPMLDRKEASLYAFVDGNPIVLVDPEGLAPQDPPQIKVNAAAGEAGHAHNDGLIERSKNRTVAEREVTTKSRKSGSRVDTVTMSVQGGSPKNVESTVIQVDKIRGKQGQIAYEPIRKRAREKIKQMNKHAKAAEEAANKLTQGQHVSKKLAKVGAISSRETTLILLDGDLTRKEVREVQIDIRDKVIKPAKKAGGMTKGTGIGIIARNETTTVIRRTQAGSRFRVVTKRVGGKLINSVSRSLGNGGNLVGMIAGLLVSHYAQKAYANPSPSTLDKGIMIADTADSFLDPLFWISLPMSLVAEGVAEAGAKEAGSIEQQTGLPSGLADAELMMGTFGAGWP